MYPEKGKRRHEESEQLLTINIRGALEADWSIFTIITNAATSSLQCNGRSCIAAVASQTLANSFHLLCFL